MDKRNKTMLTLTTTQVYNLWKVLTLNMFIGLDSKDPTLSELGSLSQDLLLPINHKIAEIQRGGVDNEDDLY